MSHFHKKLPPLSTLVAFEAAVRLGSFSRAADEVARSQASVSRQIKQLEDSMGVSLFVRERHNVIPTKEGLDFGATIKLILGELASTTSRIRAKAHGQTVLTIFSDISIANVLISPVLGEFQRLHPELSLKVLSSYESIKDTNESFDIALQVGNKTHQRFNTYPIASDAVFPVCSPGFAAKHGVNIKANQLNRLPLLHLEDSRGDWPDWHSFLEHIEPGLKTDVAGFLFTTYEVCLQVAMRGEGVALGWARSVQRKIDEGKLVKLSNFVLPQPDCIHIHYPKYSEMNAELTSFINVLSANIEPIDY